MIDMRDAKRYVIDGDEKYTGLAGDLAVMWSIWNTLEFDGKINFVQVVPISLKLAPVLGRDDSLGYFCGRHDIPGIASKTFIGINVALNAESACYYERTLYHELAETLLHEMCHQWCHQNRVKDCDPDGTHTKVFRDTATAHGLTCYERQDGWSLTRVRKGHWKPFYDAARRFDDAAKAYDGYHGGPIAHKLRSTHIRHWEPPCTRLDEIDYRLSIGAA